MAWRYWTTTEARTAERMRWDGATYAEIGAELDRSPHSVSDFLAKRGKTQTRQNVERENMLRKALPMFTDGVPLTRIMQRVQWPATRQALHSSLQRYRARIGSTRVAS